MTTKASLAITKKEIVLAVASITLFVSVLRFLEKKIEDAQGSVLQTSRLELKSFVEKSDVEILSIRSQVSVERVQRQEDMRSINGKLDTITNMLIRMNARGRPSGNERGN